jgi:hypothetical protein
VISFLAIKLKHMGVVGSKIKEGFNWLGKKMGEGWEHVKSFGKMAWDKVKSVPVLGKIAEGIEKYTPIGWTATNLLKGVDAVATGGSKLLQGDIKGVVDTGIKFGRDQVNYKNPLLEKVKEIPVLGKAVSLAEKGASYIPIWGGMSANDLRSVGNAALNATEAVKNGNIKGALGEGLKGAGAIVGAKVGGAGGLLAGQALTTAGNAIT